MNALFATPPSGGALSLRIMTDDGNTVQRKTMPRASFPFATRGKCILNAHSLTLIL
ncbi:hypothetical protein J0S82_018285 [Galemys pyrenaicus]|uniref:Uncharacterized protein n=1 Tax=Galemys pyrenaicus TaxID=202257 RepID=A0A8J6A7P0_GALPY|nr:hypothetical protein J0S82_018285 [Galemys pyrenaicus]